MQNFENIQTICYLGPQSSFTEMAKDYFSEKLKINAYGQAFETVKQVVEYVNNNPDSLGVLPMENSIRGTVRETLDNLILAKNPNIKILAEYYQPINYCLLSRTTEIYSISGIIAPPEMLAKCREFVKNDMPFNVNIIESSSMPEAARSLQNYNLTYSSIGTPKTAEAFYLNILKENINDDKTDQTRYILFGDFETEETGNDKTSIAFSANNKPGALLQILNIFMKNDINLSYIASHPSNHKFGEYILTVTFDGHVRNPQIIKTLQEVKEKAKFMKFLGSYKKAKPVTL
ncbi:ACT domain-containing protein [bacterium]|nr:ACT domain-containing protein [bacterium]